MESKARLLGHPVHPMLIVFPLGLLATSVIFDIITIVSQNGRWSAMAYYLIGAGLIGGVLAAVFGVVDFLAIPKKTRARAIGAYHGITNAVVLLLFLASWALRRDEPGNPETAALALSFLGAVLATIGGWLGGELVDRLGVGVSDGANLNAPNALSKQPARKPLPRR